jgi:hypothetical protein
MTNVTVTPPDENNTEITVSGRHYVCMVGQTISVPDFDADKMTANGWTYATPLQRDALIATTAIPGTVKPDGSTITIDDDGTIHSEGGGGSSKWKYINANLYPDGYNAVAGDWLMVDTSSGSGGVVDITLPFPVNEGDSIRVFDISGSFSQNPCILFYDESLSFFAQTYGALNCWLEGEGPSVINFTNFDNSEIVFQSDVDPPGYWIADTVANVAFAPTFSNSGPNSGWPVSIWQAGTPDSSGQNIDIALRPANSGAIVALVPDGTGSGGNKRGQFAVDLQLSIDKGSPTTVASGQSSYCEGDGNTASSMYAHAEGKQTIASGFSSHAEGTATTASSSAAHAEGSGTVATSSGAHAEGEETQATGGASHAEGGSTTASGLFAHAEGYLSSASGQSSHAEGSQTQTNNTNDHAEGYQTTASGGSSHAEGNGSQTTGSNSHAEGLSTLAGGNAAHAEGNSTSAGGDFSHAEGGNTTASGTFAHAEGAGTTANGYASSASGADSTTRGINFARAYSNGAISIQGDSQFIRLGLNGQTTDATPKVLTSDTNSPNASNQLALVDDETVFADVLVMGKVAGQSDCIVKQFQVIIQRGTGAGSVAIPTTTPTTPAVIASYATAGAISGSWAIALSADTINGTLAITVTGVSATTINWNAEVRSRGLVL